MDNVVRWLLIGVIALLGGVGGTYILIKIVQWQCSVEKEAVTNNKKIEYSGLLISILSLFISIIAIAISVYSLFH